MTTEIISGYEYLQEHLDGRVFETVEEFRSTVLVLIDDAVNRLYKAEDWAKRATPDVLQQLGVRIKEIEVIAD